MKESIKRLFDIVIACLGLLIGMPIFFVLTLQVYRKLGSPVFFVQIRPGKDGKPFKLVKFRTMKDIVDENGVLLPDKDRLTSFGKFLRSTSLDELPELWNVLKGEMSLVGPRPLLMEYLPLYSQDQARRHLVKPGITGWAQINGRNAIDWEEKFLLDIWYVENQSFWLDIKIIFFTLHTILTRNGVSAEGEATMPKFTGNKKIEVA